MLHISRVAYYKFLSNVINYSSNSWTLDIVRTYFCFCVWFGREVRVRFVVVVDFVVVVIMESRERGKKRVTNEILHFHPWNDIWHEENKQAT